MQWEHVCLVSFNLVSEINSFLNYAVVRQYRLQIMSMSTVQKDGGIKRNTTQE